MNAELRELAIRSLIAVVAVSWLVILWRGNRNPALKNFSIPALIMTRDGFIDRVALMELGTWMTTTVLMVILALHNKLTETFAVIYVAFPAIRAGQVSWLRSGDHAPTMDRTVTDTHEETATPSKAHEDAHDHG